MQNHTLSRVPHTSHHIVTHFPVNKGHLKNNIILVSQNTNSIKIQQNKTKQNKKKKKF